MMQPVFNKQRQLAEQILIILEGKLSGDNKHTINEIILFVEQQLAYQMKVNLFSNYKLGEPMNPGQYIATFEDCPVKNNSARNRNYIDLPARYVDLPKNRGVWSIGPMGNDYEKYIPVPLGAANFTTTHDAPFLQGNVGYEIEGLKAYLIGEPSSFLHLVQLVTPSDVDLNITADIDMLVIQDVLKLLMVEKPSDKSSDNSEAQ
jgi:hypothetical protein